MAAEIAAVLAELGISVTGENPANFDGATFFGSGGARSPQRPRTPSPTPQLTDIHPRPQRR